MSSTQNALILTQLLLQYATKMQEIGVLFQNAQSEGRDVSDAEVDASAVARDAAILRAQVAIDD